MVAAKQTTGWLLQNRRRDGCCKTDDRMVTAKRATGWLLQNRRQVGYCKTDDRMVTAKQTTGWLLQNRRQDGYCKTGDRMVIAKLTIGWLLQNTYLSVQMRNNSENVLRNYLEEGTDGTKVFYDESLHNLYLTALVYD